MVHNLNRIFDLDAITLLVEELREGSEEEHILRKPPVGRAEIDVLASQQGPHQHQGHHAAQRDRVGMQPVGMQSNDPK